MIYFYKFNFFKFLFDEPHFENIKFLKLKSCLIYNLIDPKNGAAPNNFHTKHKNSPDF